jgi:MGT family glycosyltransferase
MSTGVVLNLPEPGHMNATYPVIAELVRRGERIIYYATEPYRRRVEATGAEYRSYGGPADFMPPAHRGGLYSVMAWEIGLAERLLPQLESDLRAINPDYMLIDSMCVWGHLLRQMLPVPAAMLASVFVPDDRAVSVGDMVRRAYRNAPQEVILAGIDALNTYIQISQRIDRRHGTECPNLAQFFAGRQQLNVVFTSRYFHLEGERFDDSYKFVGPTLDPLEAAREDPPLIYISLGTIFNDAPEFYKLCFDALGGAPYKVVLSAGSRILPAELGRPPENFLVAESVDQLDVLRRASLFISHGGMNSTSEALWYGTPMLIHPRHGDQKLVAARVEELGAGRELRPRDLTLAALRAAVDSSICDPGLRQGARKIAESFRSAGGYRRAADEILRWRCRPSA